jgi:hypothetical protein
MNNELADNKRQLVARSDYFRQSMSGDLDNLKMGVAWVPRTVQVLRWAAPALAVATPIVALLMGKRVKAKPASPPKKNLFAKVLAGIAFYQKARSVVNILRPIMRA